MVDNSQQKVIINISTTTIVKVIAFLILLWFLYYIRDILIVVFVATLLAMALNPIVNWLNKKKIPRIFCVLIIYICLFTIFFGTIALIVPPLTNEVQQITSNFPILWEKFMTSFSGGENFDSENEIVNAIRDQLGSAQELLSTSATNIFSFIRNVFGNFISFMLIFVLTFYFLVQEDTIKKAFKHFTPQKYQPYMNDVLTRMQERVSMWLRGQLILVFIVGFLVLVGLKILNIKYFLLLALIAGIFEIIPYIGPILAAVPAVFIASVESPWRGLAVIMLFWLIQQMENHLIVPKVMQKMIGLNPIVIILVILIGAKLYGFLGILVAVPTAAALSVIVKDVFEKGDIQKDEGAP